MRKTGYQIYVWKIEDQGQKILGCCHVGNRYMENRKDTCLGQVICQNCHNISVKNPKDIQELKLPFIDSKYEKTENIKEGNPLPKRNSDHVGSKGEIQEQGKAVLFAVFVTAVISNKEHSANAADR